MKPIWTPHNQNPLQIEIFQKFIEKKTGQNFENYFDLHKYSLNNIPEFWSNLVEFTGAIGDFGDERFQDGTMLTRKFFPKAKINYAQNLLRFEGSETAIMFRGEDQIRQKLTRDELNAQVSQLVQFLKTHGVQKGDRVAGFLPNIPSAIVAMLAAASIGAIWSSCSPDFGKQGVLDRFGQIEPKILFAVNGYIYNGKSHDVRAKLSEILPELPSLQAVVMVDYVGSTDYSALENAVAYDEILTEFQPQALEFVPVEFDHPLFILYSSGTTGAPKCIVHGHGGTLLQHLKEHQLHCDIRPGDKVFYFTTLSWMMWNWLVSALASGATLMLYDGSPFYPSGAVLWDYAHEEKFSFFGTSAKFLEACQKNGIDPQNGRDFSALKAMASTGSPLSAEGYDYVYKNIKSDLHLASISGGTDIVSCFVLGVPSLPVYRGEIQAAGLGMAVEVWNEDGQPVQGERGELVCTQAFPSQPVGFWNDEGQKKYHAAYFERFDEIWAHGDFAEITERGGIVIYGRSDAVLNPGGVRIGTAEIYRQVDKVEEVLESIVIGQEWKGDVRVVLFVQMQSGSELNEEIAGKIRNIIRQETTPRHVPSKILAVQDIPRTKSGKIVEIPVRDIVHGRAIKNKEALANPEALKFYENRKELAED